MTIPEFQPPVYISVDVETSGPNPGNFSLLSIGACTLSTPPETFYVELKPINNQYVPEALSITGLSLETLRQTGMVPSEAMFRFTTWLEQVTPRGSKPVFVALNAPFDWSFLNDYFIRTLGRNPFGHSALDMKALYMGLTGAAWSDTQVDKMAARYELHIELTHNALQDALDQAEIFRHLLVEWETRTSSGTPGQTISTIQNKGVSHEQSK